MSEDLVTWLRAQLDDDERVARLADTPTRWQAKAGEFGPEVHISIEDANTGAARSTSRTTLWPNR